MRSRLTLILLNLAMHLCRSKMAFECMEDAYDLETLHHRGYR